MLAVVTKQASFRELDSNPHFHCPKQCVLPLNDPGSVEPLPDPNREPSAYRAAALPVAPRRQSTPGGTRNRKYTALNRARLPVAARAHESRHPGSNRAVRRTKAEPQAVRGGKAGISGFEPENLPVQGRAGLPVPPYPIEYAGRDSNPQTTAFEAVSFAG